MPPCIPLNAKAQCMMYVSPRNAIRNATHKTPQLPSHLSINLRLTPPLTTPPTPKAGTILPILAKLLPSQSLPTLPTLSRQLTPGLLYRSSPQRWSGVLTSWMPAGARNCAALALEICCSTRCERGSKGAIKGGRLKDAKIVMESRRAKRA